MKYFSFIFILTLIGCSSGATGGAKFKKGKCIERPWGAYTFQVADQANDTYFLYKVGYMGKEIIRVPFDIAHKEYVETACP
tara:strand:+ start:395 stop:637 length:243 start_codon:yes stop_codon:yes gene_type:complete